jgi:hypothetical protein
MRAHIEADDLIRGTGWDGEKGCAVGCTFNAYKHHRGPVEIGVPEWLMRLTDAIFEGVSKERSTLWPEEFLAAIPVGADLEPVQWRLAILRHRQQLEALESNSAPYARQVAEALQLTIAYCEMQLRGQDEAAVSAAVSAAWSAAGSAAAEAEAEAEAAWSARLARSAAWSARSAAWSAESAARSAARSAHYEWEADTLLQLLRETEVAV